MSLQADLAKAVEVAEAGGKRCSVCDVLATMNTADKVSLRAALTSPVGAKKLSTLLRKNGFAVGVPSVNLHRSEGHQ